MNVVPTELAFNPSSTKADLDDQVRMLRTRLSAIVAERYQAATFDREAGLSLIEASVFRDHVGDLNIPHSIRVAAFNLDLTDTCLQELISTEKDPFQLAFLASRLIENGGYSLIDPDELQKKAHQFLGASKQAGYFFTPPSVATEMARAVLAGKLSIDHCLDPAAGAGALLASVAIEANKSGVVIKHLVAIERDELTARWCEQILLQVRRLLRAKWKLTVHKVDALEYLSNSTEEFDSIIMNPPYGRIKFLKSSLTNAETRTCEKQRSLDDQETYWRVRIAAEADRHKAVSRSLGLGSGRQDFQRLFVGIAIKRLTKDGRFAFISPASWLGDVDSTSLRKHLIDERLIEAVWIYPEDSGLFATVNQVTAVTIVASAEFRTGFEFDVRCRPNMQLPNDVYEITYESIEKFDPERLRIPKVNRLMHEAYSNLQCAPRLGEMLELRNARGELDQSLGSACIVDHPTEMRLIRGDHVERFSVSSANSSERAGFVEVSLINEMISPNKIDDIHKLRVVGRQVSYMNKPRRLSWALLQEPSVVGNSCNYIVVKDQGSEQQDLLFGQALVAMLNSAVIEWYFRVYNSNNHVANYEIDEFPACLKPEYLPALAAAGRFLANLYSSEPISSRVGSIMEDCLDALVAYFFGLTAEQSAQVIDAIEFGRGRRVGGMVAWFGDSGVPESLSTGIGWYQHIEASLSAHDREVIDYIPQGGNWTSIPTTVPSRRLEQIREMTKERGGLVRTSYYGRLRPDQPSYTIATYYNRPGNGTNIPPWEDRVLTSREAARLQSFPDWYIFVSKETGVRKQIGNAVPPLLAYALGQTLLQRTGPLCVDLFAGAGGLSLGLELAGVEIIGACDNDARAADTYRFNRPCESFPSDNMSRTLFLESDLSAEQSRREVAMAFKGKLSGRPLDILVGGPPCQGFSHAGWRVEADERNDLAAAFLEFAELLDPKVVVLENVDGLLSYNKGQVVRELIEAMQELGYQTGSSPWLLNAECYGVPQMRRRVFLVGIKNDIAIEPPTPRFQKCRGRREVAEAATSSPEPYPTTVLDALFDLPRIGGVAHPEIGPRSYRPWFSLWARGSISPEDFYTGMSTQRQP